MSKTSPPIPATGGSFVVDAKGKLVQREKTLAPLDPEHAANRPAEATGPAGPKES